MAMEAPWVVAEYPVHSMAQDAGMTFAQYAEFIFAAVLVGRISIEEGAERAVLFGLPLAHLDGVEGSAQDDQKYGGSDDDAY